MSSVIKAMPITCLLLLVLLLAAGAKSTGPADALRIPNRPAIQLNGIISPGEWEHAAALRISVSRGWEVKVLAQHDEQNLYLAFIGLRHGKEERYPEVLIDSANQRALLWNGGEWWLHASYNLCEGHKPNQYSTCKPSQEGWQATRFPRENGVSEIAISLTKAGLTRGRSFSIAFDVTDTHKSWSFWPAGADLQVPMSWGPARLE